MFFDESPLQVLLIPFHALPIHHMNRTISRPCKNQTLILQRLEPHLVVEFSCCFSFVFLKTCSPTWPLRRVWKIGFNWCHILFGKKARIGKNRCLGIMVKWYPLSNVQLRIWGGRGWRSLCNEPFWPVNLFGDGVLEERCIISQYFFHIIVTSLCSCLADFKFQGVFF